MNFATRIESSIHRVRSLSRHLPEQWAISDWNRAYASGDLDYFGDLDELPRYSILIGYLRRLENEPDIIDVGSGSGLFRRHLESATFASYLGIDISDEAVREATALLADVRTTFVCGDVMTTDLPTADVVVLNEVLYFVPDAGALLQRVAQLLRPEGRVLVSIWRQPGDRHLWKQLGRHFQLEDQVAVRNPASKLARRGWRLACYRRWSSSGDVRG